MALRQAERYFATRARGSPSAAVVRYSIQPPLGKADNFGSRWKRMRVVLSSLRSLHPPSAAEKTPDCCQQLIPHHSNSAEECCCRLAMQWTHSLLYWLDVMILAARSVAAWTVESSHGEDQVFVDLKTSGRLCLQGNVTIHSQYHPYGTVPPEFLELELERKGLSVILPLSDINGSSHS